MTSEVPESSLKTIFDPTTCVKKGLCPVTKLRGQDQDPLESHSLYYELHGTGPEKLLLIYGMNATSFGWEHQVEHFGRSDKYSVLVFDNRGVGNSGTPRGPYRTSDMAQDTIALLDFIGWTSKRDIHVVGASLGGMIALEMATRIPERIVSLTLGVTTAGGRPWNNLPPWKGFSLLTKTFTMRDPKQRIPIALEALFPEVWLNSKAAGDAASRTNREVQAENYSKRVAVTRVQQPMGSASQMYAGLTHHVTPERLRSISSTIPKVLIVTGDDDNLVLPANSKYLKEKMPEAEFVQWEASGHALQLQHPDRFDKLVERVINEGRQKASSGRGSI